MKNLFDDFNSITSKQWKQQIQFDLKGADYNETLIWNSPENIKVKPFYHKDEFNANPAINSKATEFKICQNIFVYDLEKSNRRAIESINRGAESICFTIENETIDVKRLLENILINKIPIFFHLSFISIDFVKKINSIAKEENTIIFCKMDPIGQLAKEGNWFETNEKNNFETLNLISSATTNISFISIDAGLYQNAGANMVQQIAYTLGHANEYFNRISTINNPIVFEIAVGTNYFFEIAKLRAIRLLFNLISK
jgi:methylmalonyl-CoA mutase